MMEKRAVVVVGKTPDADTGKPSTMIKNGEAVAAKSKGAVVLDTEKRSAQTEKDVTRSSLKGL